MTILNQLYCDYVQSSQTQAIETVLKTEERKGYLEFEKFCKDNNLNHKQVLALEDILLGYANTCQKGGFYDGIKFALKVKKELGY